MKLKQKISFCLLAYHRFIPRLFLLGALLSASLQGAVETIPQQPKAIKVVSFNVDNYITMPRWVNGRFRNNAGKPESEKAAVANVLSTLHPDIVAFMEMGDLRQVRDLEHRLRDVGLNYPYSEYLQGSDKERHLLLLSRFPLLSHHSQPFISLSVHGQHLQSPRGILDVTIELEPGYELRLIALHLKAKVPSEEYNQSELRIAEAHFVHEYLNKVLTIDPKTRLLVMGDFNDTKNSKTLLTILGKSDLAKNLHALSLTDDRHESWTEYWKAADEYSRIDYMLVNSELEKDIQLDHSGIARPSFWNEASDHCALFTMIIPKQGEKNQTND